MRLYCNWAGFTYHNRLNFVVLNWYIVLLIDWVAIWEPCSLFFLFLFSYNPNLKRICFFLFRVIVWFSKDLNFPEIDCLVFRRSISLTQENNNIKLKNNKNVVLGNYCLFTCLGSWNCQKQEAHFLWWSYFFIRLTIAK